MFFYLQNQFLLYPFFFGQLFEYRKIFANDLAKYSKNEYGEYTCIIHTFGGDEKQRLKYG